MGPSIHYGGIVVLVFDLDGVLVKSTFFSDVLLRMICHHFEANDITIERGVVFQEILSRFIQKLNEEDKIPAYDWDLLIREYMGEFNLSWKCEIEEVFNSDEITQYSSLYRDTGVLEVLLEKGYEMALLTNGLDKYQDSIITKLGLQRFFKRIIMPDPGNMRFVKPHPEIFKETVRGFEKPHVMIGDSLYFDIYGANRVGFQTVWLLRKPPARYKKLSIEARTERINGNERFLLQHILRGASFLQAKPAKMQLEKFRPDYIICNLNELVELF